MNIRNKTVFSMMTVAAASGLAIAGPLTPPPGPVGSTYKTLTEVEPRLVLDQNTAPGDGDSLFKITSAGSYYLSASYSASAGRGVIKILASNVTIDLNGFRLAGQAGSIDSIFTSGAVSNITIRNGSIITPGGDGVDTASATGVKLENLRIRGAAGVGIRLGASSIVESTEVADSGSHGMVLGDRAIVRDSRADNSGGDGVRVTGQRVQLQRVSACGNAGNGVTVQAAGARLTGCTFSDNQQTGASLAGSSNLESSTISNNAQVGVSLRTRDRLADCTVSNNTFNGVSVSGAGIIENNRILDNLDHGVYTYTIANTNSGYMQIRNNTLIGNGDAAGEYGIYCSTGSFNGVIDGNILRLNRGGIRVLGSTFTIMRNFSGPNGGASYQIEPNNLNDLAPVLTSTTSGTNPLANFDGGFYLVP